MTKSRPPYQLELALPMPGRGEAPCPDLQEVEAVTATAEPESPASTAHLMEAICAPDNIEAALRAVVRNKGAPGVDGITVKRLPGILKARWPEIEEQLLQGRYQPQPVRRVRIPKPAGGTRNLGIPTVIDRVIHDRLMAAVAARVSDRRVLRLIRGYLTAGVLDGGLFEESREGTPQGGPLSPLLSNLVLDELDRELERRGHRFVRYADDCNIYVGSERAGQRVMESVTHFITHRLKLKVSQAKSAVARPGQRKFLGFSFTSEREPRRRIAPKAIARFKQRIREITRRAKGISIKTTMEELAPYMRGWRGYFGFCETPEVLIALTRWVRLRLRAALWKQWKTP